MIEILQENFSMAKEFHETFTKKLETSPRKPDILAFRKHILITLINNVNSLFKDDRIIQMYYNALHSVFTLSEKFNFRITLEDEKFRYFFYATLFLVSKFDNNDYFKCFLQKALKEEMNLNYLCTTEFMILEKIRKIYYFSPEEISKLFLNKLGQFTDKDIINKIAETFNIFIYFALSEFDIYCKFDQFSISLACIYLSIKNVENCELLNEFLSCLKCLNYEQCVLMKCVEQIETLLGKEEECDSPSKISPSTSVSSHSSHNKENVKKKTVTAKKNGHNKINKLNTLYKQRISNTQPQKSQNSIPYYYCKTKRKLNGRKKSI